MHRRIVVQPMPDVVHFEIKRIAVDGRKGWRQRSIDAFEVMLLLQPERIHDFEFPLQAARA